MACLVLLAGGGAAGAQDSSAPPDRQWTLALSGCMEKVMPMPAMSPVDIEQTHIPFTPAKQGALHDCMKAQGYDFGQALTDIEPVSDKDVQDDWAAHAEERARRSQDTRDYLKARNLEKFFPAEGAGHLVDPSSAAASSTRIPTMAGTVTSAQQAQPTQGLSAAGQTDTAAQQQEKPAAVTTTESPAVSSSQGLFVPSKNNGPTLIFLH